MPISYVVDGPVNVKLDTGAANALEQLGFSEDGVRVTENAFYSDVHTDQNGGTEGPPGDIQYFGEVHNVEMTLTRYDDVIVDKLLPKVRGGTVGATSTPGTLMAQDGKGFRLLLHSTSKPRNYLFAILRGGQECNKGTKHRKMILRWECHAVSGVLYNTTTT